jgi:hypothetical protein
VDGFPLAAVAAQAGPFVLAAVICFFIVRAFVNGVIYARSVVEDLRKDRDEWRAIARQATDQSSQLLEYAKTADSILRALQEAARVRQP